MKLSLALLSALLAAICQISYAIYSADCPAFTIDRQYVYKYKSRAATGIPKENILQFSGLGLKAVVIIQNQGSYVYVKLDQLEFGTFNDKIHTCLDCEFPVKYEAITDNKIKEVLTKPVRVVIEKGIVKTFDVYYDEPEWSVNIKKAILSLFQLDLEQVQAVRFSKSNYLKLEDEADFYRVFEDGISGECETVYEISSLPNPKYPYEKVLNVTKNRLFDKCTHHPDKFYTTHLGHKCSECETFNFKPLTSHAETDYQIRGDRHFYTIEKISNFGRFVFSPFTTSGETIISGVNQTLTLVDTDPINEPIKFFDKFRTYNTLSFNMSKTSEKPTTVDLHKTNYPHNPLNVFYTNAREKVGTLLHGIVEDHKLTDDLHDEHNTPEEFLKLVKLLISMDYETIEDMYKAHCSGASETETKHLRGAFFDALTVAGTNPSVLFLLNKVIKEKVPVPDFNLQRIAFYVKVPSEKLIEEIYTLIKSLADHPDDRLYVDLWLLFGTIVHRGCENVVGYHDSGFHHAHHHKTLVAPETCDHYVVDIHNLLDKATDVWKKILFIKVLSNMGLKEVYTYLKPIVTGDIYYPETARLQAFWGLYHYAHDMKEEVLTLVMPVFLNYTETPLIRIAAFEVVMGANPSTLEPFVDLLHKEPSTRVASYMYSTFKVYANSTQPCDFKLSKLSRKILSHIDHHEFSHLYPTQLYYNYYNKKYAFGGSTWMSWAASNESFIPDNFYLENSANILGYNFDYFSFGIETKGLQAYIEASLYGSKHAGGSGTVKKEYDEIIKTLDIHPHKPPKPEILLTASSFYQDLTFFYFDKFGKVPTSERAKPEFPFPKPLETNVNFKKNLMLADVLYLVPTEIGFPLKFNLKVPAHFSLNGAVTFKATPTTDPSKHHMPNVQLATDLTTMWHIKAIGKVALITPFANEYGYAITYNYITKLPLKLQVGLVDDKFDVIYTPTKIPYEMYHQDVTPFTYAVKSGYGQQKVEMDKKPIVYRKNPHVHKNQFLSDKYFGAAIKFHTTHQKDWDDFSSYYKYFLSFFTKKSGYDTYKYPYYTAQKFITAHTAFSDYYSLYPSWKPYEYKVFFEPSTTNPTFQYEFIFDYHKILKTSAGIFEPDYTKTHVTKVDPTFRKVYSWSFDLIAKSNVQRSYHIDFNVSYPYYGTMPQKIAIDYWRTPVPNYDADPFKICYRESITIPPIDNFYTIDKVTEQKAETLTNIFFGKDCETDDKKVVIKTTIEKTDQQKYYDTHPEMYYEAYNECLEDIKHGYNSTTPCWEYFLDYYTLRKYTFDVEYKNVPEFFSDKLDSFSNWFKHVFFYNIEKLDKHATNNPPGHLKIVANVSSDVPARADIKVYRPGQTVYYHDIGYPAYIPFFKNFLVRWPLLDTVTDSYFPHLTDPSCMILKNHTETFDGINYHWPLSNCYHVVTKLCTMYNEANSFTVMAKTVKHQYYTTALKMLVMNHKIELLPIGDNPETAPLVLRIDDTKQILETGSVFFVPDPTREDHTAFKIYTVGKTYLIYVPAYELAVIYDGVFLRVKIPKKFRGQVCGTCGDYNAEHQYEFTGPDDCVYRKVKWFVNSYAIPDGSCEVPTTDKTHCYYPYAPKYPGKCTYSRNKVIHDIKTDDRTGRPANNACFSKFPIDECAVGCKPTKVVKRRVGFHCLNKRDSYTNILIETAKTRVLPEIRKKSEDYSEIVSYPERCVKG